MFFKFKKPNYFNLFTQYYGIFVTFFKIIKMVLSIFISTLRDEKVHFKWCYEKNLESELDFKASPPILASVPL